MFFWFSLEMLHRFDYLRMVGVEKMNTWVSKNNIGVTHKDVTLQLDIDHIKKTVHIWATDQSGGFTIAIIRFLDDRVQVVEQ